LFLGSKLTKRRLNNRDALNARRRSWCTRLARRVATKRVKVPAARSGLRGWSANGYASSHRRACAALARCSAFGDGRRVVAMTKADACGREMLIQSRRIVTPFDLVRETVWKPALFTIICMSAIRKVAKRPGRPIARPIGASGHECGSACSVKQGDLGRYQLLVTP
jgi:hypothetical protein